MTAYSISENEQRKSSGHKCKLQALADGCPVEDLFAAQFNAGTIAGLPPFLTADRMTMLARAEVSCR